MLLLLAAAALASPAGLTLPSSERDADWEQPLSVAGLAASLDGASVEFEVRGSQWVVHARTRDGAERSATIEAPTDDASRERVALLVASLLAGATPALPLPDLPLRAGPEPSPAPAPSPARARARQRRLSLASSEEAWQAPVEADEVVAGAAPLEAPPELAPVAGPSPRAPAAMESPAPARRKEGAPWWLSARAGMAMREPQAPYGSLSVAGGPLLTARTRLGLGASFSTPTPVPFDGTDVRITATDGYVGAWSGGLVEVGALGGISRRSVSQVPDAFALGFLGAEASVVLQAGPRALLRAPTVRFQYDLVPTWITYDGDAISPPRASFHLDFDVVFLGRPDHSPRVGALSRQ